MTDPRLETFIAEVKKVHDYLHMEFAKLQTGRASALLVEGIEVEAYGQTQPLKAVAGITIEDARTIKVQPWDKGVYGDVETALTKADLGTAPQGDGSVLRIILPPMTEETRKTIAKRVHELAEESKISVRHLRHEAKSEIEKETDEDVRDTLLGELDKENDKANKEIEESMKKKEEEVMTV